MFVGQWIAVNDDGLWTSIIDEGVFAFESKKELIDDIRTTKEDPYKRPHIKRLSKGRYVLSIGDMDGKGVAETYTLVRLNKENIVECKKIIDYDVWTAKSG